jgi:hypothetical protein
VQRVQNVSTYAAKCKLEIVQYAQKHGNRIELEGNGQVEKKY